MMKKIRLSDYQIKAIKNSAKEIFGENVEVYIFGSRVNQNKKGGDIDILIITNDKKNLFQKKLKLLASLYKKIGEQKIDVIITDKPKTDIEKTAIKTGVKL